MSIKADRWIRRMAEEHGMIEPFEPGQVREDESGRIVSYGTSSYGYDVRCADEFKIFTNIESAMVDPKRFPVELRRAAECLGQGGQRANDSGHRVRAMRGLAEGRRAVADLALDLELRDSEVRADP